MSALKRWLGYVLLLLVLAFGVFFSIQNPTRVPLDLLVVQLSQHSVALWVLLSFAVGGVIGLIVSGVALIRLKSHVAFLRHRVTKLNKELDKMRTNDLRPALPNGANHGQKKGK